MSFLIGLAALIVLWYGLKVFAKASPAALAGNVRKVGGFIALAFAAMMMFRMRVEIAIPLAYFGLWLLGWGNFGIGSFGSTAKPSGMTSRVRSATIEMELDHDTGALRGRVLVGPREGAELDALGREQLFALYEDCRAQDQDGARLLQAYFDRRFPGWREDAHRHDDPGPDSHAHPGSMTEQEAYEILGLHPGAGEDDIRRAHRALMKKLHPDQGGSTYLATRVNQAKDVLLSRHR